jgi:tetratricopeptide (TPR) repeat protein
MKSPTRLALICLSLLTSFLFGQTNAPGLGEQLQQLTTQLQNSPGDQALREKIINMAKAVAPPPALPEEAGRRMARGVMAFKEAKSVSDYKDAVVEFEKATMAAPWYADAYYNLALADDAVGDHKAAIATLHLYQLFKLSEAETRTAQEKIYAIEANVAKAETRLAEEGSALIEKLTGAIFAGDDSTIYFVKDPLETPGESSWKHIANSNLYCQRGVIQNGRKVYAFPLVVKPTGSLTFGEDIVFYGKFILSEDGQTLTEQFDSPSVVHVYKRKK